MNEAPRPNRIEVHDRDALAQAARARRLGRRARHGRGLKDAVGRNAQWRGEECINLLAPEAPTSPGVRALLAAESAHARPRPYRQVNAGSPARGTSTRSRRCVSN